MKRYLYQNSWIILSVAIFLLVWESVSKIIGNQLIFPSIISISLSLKEIVLNEEFSLIVFHTIKRTGMSIIISIVIGIICSTFAYRYKFFYLLFFPFFTFLKSIPTIAVIILVLIWSSPEKVPFVAGVIILLPLFYENLLGGLNSIDRDLLKMGEIYRVSKWDILKGIIIPSIYFFIAPTLPAVFGLGLKVVIAGEILAQEDFSIGGEIFMGKIYLESSSIFAWIIIVILINFLIDISMKYFDKKISLWKNNQVKN